MCALIMDPPISLEMAVDLRLACLKDLVEVDVAPCDGLGYLFCGPLVVFDRGEAFSQVFSYQSGQQVHECWC